MVEPVKVWVAYSANGEPCFIDDKSEDDCWIYSAGMLSSYPEHLAILNLKAEGWTVRPMTLLDGHGEQNAELREQED